MTLLHFPDRIAQVRAKRAARRRAPTVSLVKLATTLWLVPVLFWLAWLDVIEDEAENADDPLPGDR